MNKALPLAFALGTIITPSAQAFIDADLSSSIALPTYSTLSDQVSSAETKRELAYSLSRQYRQLAPVLHNEIDQYKLNAPLKSFKRSKRAASFTRNMMATDQRLRAQKGIDGYTDEIMELRLADQAMLARWQAGQAPLFAWEPDGNDKNWDYIEAYDVNGNIHLLDVYEAPERPVLVVDTNSRKELEAGIQAMNDEIKRLQGEQSDAAPRAMALSMASEPLSISTTVLEKIRLADDQEPWISGKAEVYAIVTGVNPTRDEPVIDVIDMPYLDYSETEYFPNQVLIYWQRYRWAAADMLLMEKDDSTNYKDLAKTLLEVATEALKAIPDPEVQAYAVIPQLTGKILEAIPASWMTNDDDFVDVYYTIRQGKRYTDHPGAGNNAKATFAPLTIDPTE
ncbi:DUF3103 domain-containing protein [Photobacterium lipolyticum]|uniref:DUF3103 domain-containing protein n=1 Tax=Photobacterium lipolyticum TaxID=266810 RepID=A0A2T3N370_9GAMM|nr:DUF3103 domain-containing protein [Photobacterium lipolyticum]PSW06812.1 DUF3103 domain-containing protein [Photobacterium lipolyticum]